MSGKSPDPRTGAEHPSRSLLWSLVESGGLSLLSLAVLLVVARLAGPADLGAFAIAFGIVQILTLAVDTLVHDALIQRSRLSDDDLHTAFWACLGLGVVLSASCWLAAPAIAQIFDTRSVAPLVAVGSLGLIASAAGSVPIALLHREMRFKPLALRSLCGRLGGAIAAVALVAAGYGVWALIVQHLVQVAVGAVLVWPAVAWRPSLRFSFARLRKLLSFGAFSVGTRIVWVSGGKIFVLIIGNFLGVAAVGYLNIAQRIVDTLFDLLAGAAHNLALPILSRRQLDRPAFTRAYAQATELTAFMTQPMFGGLAVCAPAIITVLLGESWISAAPVVQVLAVGTMIQFLLLFGPAATTARGRPGVVFGVSLVSLGTAICALLLLRPDDVVDAAMIWASRIFLGGTLLHVILSRLLGVSPALLVKVTWVPVSATAVMALSLLVLEHQWLAPVSSTVKLVTMVAAGVAIYGAIIALTGRKSLVRLLQFASSHSTGPKLGGSA